MAILYAGQCPVVMGPASRLGWDVLEALRRYHQDWVTGASAAEVVEGGTLGYGLLVGALTES
jgi:hypothetical protein